MLELTVGNVLITSYIVWSESQSMLNDMRIFENFEKSKNVRSAKNLEVD